MEGWPYLPMRSDFINWVKMSDYKGSDKAGPAGL